jgi:hypothetical protein
MSNIVEDKYGNIIDKMAGTVTDENGNQVVNEARAAQINAVVTQWSTSETEAMDKALENINVNNVKTNNSLKKYGYDISNDKDLALTYAEKVLGYDRDELTYKGGIGKGTVKDAEGNEIVNGVSDEVMRKQLAKLAMTESITNEYSNKIDKSGLLENLETAMQGMEDLGKKYGTDFTDAFLNAITSDSKQLDLSSLYAYLDPTEIEELGSMSGED